MLSSSTSKNVMYTCNPFVHFLSFSFVKQVLLLGDNYKINVNVNASAFSTPLHQRLISDAAIVCLSIR